MDRIASPQRKLFQIICMDSAIVGPLIEQLQQQINAQIVQFDGDPQTCFNSLGTFSAEDNVLMLNCFVSQQNISEFAQRFSVNQVVTAVIGDEASLEAVTQLLAHNEAYFKIFPQTVSADDIVEYLASFSIPSFLSEATPIPEPAPHKQPEPVQEEPVQLTQAELLKQIQNLQTQLREQTQSKLTDEKLLQENKSLQEENSKLLALLKTIQPEHQLAPQNKPSPRKTEQPKPQPKQMAVSPKKEELKCVTQRIEELSDIPQLKNKQGDEMASSLRNGTKQDELTANIRHQIQFEKANDAFSNLPRPVPKTLICRLCLLPFRKPVTLPCGHSFCLKCLAWCERIQFKTASGLDQAFQCPGGQFDVDTNEFAKCSHEYDTQPEVNVGLESQVDQYLLQRPCFQLGDWVVLFEEDIAQVVELVSQKVGLQNVQMAILRTLQGSLVRTELFNIAPLNLQHTIINTRVQLGDLLVKNTKRVQKAEYSPTEYLHDMLKFQDLPTVWLAASGSPCFQLLGFSHGEFLLKSSQQQNNVKEVNLDSYFSVKLQAPRRDQCQGCGSIPRVAVKTQCGCQYCSFCFCKLCRNQLPCLKCGQELQLKGTIPETEVYSELDFQETDAVCIYKENLCTIVQQLNSDYFVVQDGAK